MDRELQIILIEDDPIACKDFKEYIDSEDLKQNQDNL